MVNSDLPSGWAWTTLENVCSKIQDGTHFSPKTQYSAPSEGRYLYITAKNIKDNGIDLSDVTYIDESVHKPIYARCNPERGDLLLTKDGIKTGAVTINQLDEEFSLLSSVALLKPKREAIIPLFLKYYLSSPFGYGSITGAMTGTAIKRIILEKIRVANVPIAPLPEQEQIVAKIEELFTQLDAGTAALKRVQAGIKRYKASVLKAALEGRLFHAATDGESVGAHGVRPLNDDSSLAPSQTGRTPSALTESPLPDGWQWAKVGDIAEQRLGKMLDKEKNKGKPQPYLRNLNVRWFEFDLSDIQYMRVTDEELENITVRKGDLVVCEGGEPGRAAVWNKDEAFIIQKALHRVRASGNVSPTYLMYCLASDANTGRLEKYFTGSTIMHFTGQAFRNYEVPLPPLPEQHQIVAEVERRFSVVKEVEAVVTASLARASRLRQAVLKRAFEGKL